VVLGVEVLIMRDNLDYEASRIEQPMVAGLSTFERACAVLLCLVFAVLMVGLLYALSATSEVAK
jgi:hypothetical protein